MFTNILGIDFETANASRSSACAIGAVKISLSGEMIDHYYSLINPDEDFDLFNIMIHGITPEMVVDAPHIPEAMSKVFAMVDSETIVVCHNSAFDFSVIRAAQEKDPFVIPDLTFTCTYRLASRLIDGLVSYSLPFVAEACGLKNLAHHNALSDAGASAVILLQLVRDYDNDFDAMHKKANLNYGHIIGGQYDGVHKSIREPGTGHPQSRATFDIKSIQPDESSPFYGKIVSFTGKLESMTRAEAIEMINRLGGIGSDAFNAKTDFLITGYQDPTRLNGKEKSGKIERAEKMLAKGKKIEVVPEEEFLRML